MKAIEKIIGDNVRGFRHKLGISQEKFAEYADVHRTFIGTIERGEQNISVASISKMAEALKVKPYVLLYENAYLMSKEELQVLNSFGKK